MCLLLLCDHALLLVAHGLDHLQRSRLLRGRKGAPGIEQFLEVRGELHHFILREELRKGDAQTAADGLQRWE